MSVRLDAHARPPADLRETYKFYQKANPKSLDCDTVVLSLQNGALAETDRLLSADHIKLPTDLGQAFSNFLGSAWSIEGSNPLANKVYEVKDVPGLFIYPSLLPQEVQIELLKRLLHRDLSEPQHLTNTHLHYEIPYPTKISPPACGKPKVSSFFDATSNDLSFNPKDRSVHKPFSTQQFLNKKLRWMTLGGQYDWTNKVYPGTIPPPFPADIKLLVEQVFPMRAEAAIVNLYSPGDTLSLHRDVSEDCDRPLVSISLGCDALFVVGLESNDMGGARRSATIRLRSGDAVLMSGESRYAWHGVPRVFRDTCPEWMQDWPAGRFDSTDRFAEWRGWMASKRINVNIRQMFA